MMKIELNKNEMEAIENLLSEAALSTKSYDRQGKFRLLKEHFHVSLAEYERMRMELARRKK